MGERTHHRWLRKLGLGAAWSVRASGGDHHGNESRAGPAGYTNRRRRGRGLRWTDTARPSIQLAPVITIATRAGLESGRGLQQRDSRTPWRARDHQDNKGGAGWVGGGRGRGGPGAEPGLWLALTVERFAPVLVITSAGRGEAVMA